MTEVGDLNDDVDDFDLEAELVLRVEVTGLKEGVLEGEPAFEELLLVATDDELVFLVDEEKLDTLDDEADLELDADFFDMLVFRVEVFFDVENIFGDEMGKFVHLAAGSFPVSVVVT